MPVNLINNNNAGNISHHFRYPGSTAPGFQLSPLELYLPVLPVQARTAAQAVTVHAAAPATRGVATIVQSYTNNNASQNQGGDHGDAPLRSPPDTPLIARRRAPVPQGQPLPLFDIDDQINLLQAFLIVRPTGRPPHEREEAWWCVGEWFIHLHQDDAQEEGHDIIYWHLSGADAGQILRTTLAVFPFDEEYLPEKEEAEAGSTGWYFDEIVQRAHVVMEEDAYNTTSFPPRYLERALPSAPPTRVAHLVQDEFEGVLASLRLKALRLLDDLHADELEAHSRWNEREADKKAYQAEIQRVRGLMIPPGQGMDVFDQLSATMEYYNEREELRILEDHEDIRTRRVKVANHRCMKETTWRHAERLFALWRSYPPM
ncbi:hypothetical protein G7K_4291-t1 [Saitoella complicata NRRL Y-17804]|uniref:Uncharacterized protein n=1 Tax=Saitoella complicata (strain BCRC 22490 / CBS 7301 / JCM 7358 / NBRC 10748 / NRRL Y-17804) TaxID=698492 RepID=A0A0E9NJV0_SAICN|nr:hypothetical protein G7K_4291-t1 [Saitoella complicata NRRL Y-17804]